jgi:hypothetical protein
MDEEYDVSDNLLFLTEKCSENEVANIQVIVLVRAPR